MEAYPSTRAHTDSQKEASLYVFCIETPLQSSLDSGLVSVLKYR